MKIASLKILLSCFLMIFSFGAYTQNNIDSLRKVLETQKEDTNRVNTLNWLAGSYVLMDDRKNGMEYADQALFLSKKIDFKKGKGEAYNNIGFIYMLERNFDDAHKNARLALVIMEDIGSKAGISACYDVIRSLYTVQDNIPEALRYSYLKFKIDEEIGDKKGMGESLYSIGYLYSSLHNDAEALKNYLASYKVHEEIGDKELIAVSAIRLGDIYYNQGNYFEALKYDSVALRIYQKLGRGQLHGLPNCYLNIGKVFAKLGEAAHMKGDKATAENNFYKAKENFLATLKLCDEYKIQEVLPMRT
jgi:tetratricopeptide (TPR) repeat protein